MVYVIWKLGRMFRKYATDKTLLSGCFRKRDRGGEGPSGPNNLMSCMNLNNQDLVSAAFCITFIIGWALTLAGIGEVCHGLGHEMDRADAPRQPPPTGLHVATRHPVETPASSPPPRNATSPPTKRYQPFGVNGIIAACSDTSCYTSPHPETDPRDVDCTREIQVTPEGSTLHSNGIVEKTASG